MGTPGSFSSSFDAIANAKTGYCVGVHIRLPDTETIAGAAFRKTIAELSPLQGRNLFATGRFESPGDIEAAFGLLMHAASDPGLRPVICLSSLPKGAVDRSDVIAYVKKSGLPVVLDQFGSLADSTHLLLDCAPDFVRFDPAVITGIADDARRRVVVANMVGMAHTLGIEVIAGGVEGARDFKVCRDLGIDMVQGGHIQSSVRGGDILPHFPHLTMDHHPAQHRSVDRRWITQQIEMIPPIAVDTPIKHVFDRMAEASETNSVFPLIDTDYRPLGLLHERTFKNLAYSAYGRELISNRGWGKTLRDFVTRCPIAETTTPLDQMLAIYSAAYDTAGILLTDGGAYAGFLSAPSLIRAIHERTLARAQDENPLTRLPGNSMIGEYLAEGIGRTEPIILAYVDFDNFKPFNDTYGFRLGDRAILLFADLLRKLELSQGWFVGHIGGDDFFLGTTSIREDEALAAIAALIADFQSDAQSFYDAESRMRGFIQAQDRDGNPRTFPLLSASVVVVCLPQGQKKAAIDDISTAIAHHKKEAKLAPSKVSIVHLD